MQKTIKKNQDIFINFGGFYNSIHETQIENLIENFENDNDNFNARFCEVDFFKTKINYSKHYLKSIEQFLFDNKINVKIEFLRIESPREYNFKTDKIVVNILKKYQKLILDFVKNNYKNELIELIKSQTTTRSGYHPFFNFLVLK